VTQLTSEATSGPGCLARIRSQLPALNDSELKVAQWVLQNPEQVIRLSMAQVAQECNTSDTTVLRFCRNAGFHGYTDLKILLAQDLARPGQMIHSDVLETDDAAAVTRKVFMANVEVLRDTLEVMDMGALARAVDLLANARRILFIGVGTSGPIVQDAYNRFMRLGVNVSAHTDSYLQLMDVSLIGPEDVVVGISQSGSSTDPILTMELAKKRGAKTIVITGNAQSPLTAQADITFVSVSRELRNETIASRIAQHTIIDALYVNLALRKLDVAVRNERMIWESVLPKTI